MQRLAAVRSGSSAPRFQRLAVAATAAPEVAQAAGIANNISEVSCWFASARQKLRCSQAAACSAIACQAVQLVASLMQHGPPSVLNTLPERVWPCPPAPAGHW